VVGYEDDEASVPVPYVAMHLFGAAMGDLLKVTIPGMILAPASEMLRRLRSILTPGELERVRTACRIGARAFGQGAITLRAGASEVDVANSFQALLGAQAKISEDVVRADGSVWCMSGPNSALSYKAFAQTRARHIEPGDVALIHCNSYADGYWTDITRTFCLGEPDERKQAIYEAVFAASRAAIEVIKPGARAADVDHAARDVLGNRGFANEFRHPTGHGAGFAAISHNARPRLHPRSPDVLETGMVFNIGPAVYIEGYGGVRHCDMVAVTVSGTEVLTPFQSSVEELVVTA
jgi:Xaa-Pro aminopeptidase